MNSEAKPAWTETFQELMPNVTPSSALSTRVATLAASADVRQIKSAASYRVLRLSAGIVLAATVVAIVVASAVIGPKMAFARTLHTVSLNFLTARGYHSRIQFLHNGRTSMQADIWYRDGKWREDSDADGGKFTQIRAGGKVINYQAGADCATSQTVGIDGKIGISLAQLRAEVQHTLSNAKAERIASIRSNGRNLMGVAEPSPTAMLPFLRARPGRSLLWIDTEKMLPIVSESQIWSQGRWETVLRADFDFEHPAPNSIFALSNDKLKVTDVNSYGAMVGARFAKPMARTADSRGGIAIRDAQVNPDGDVFILFTNGSTRANWIKDCSWSDIKDDIGTTYAGTAGAIEPFLYCEKAEESRGITVGRETMQGLCLVPPARLAGQPLPKRITLTFGYSVGPIQKTFRVTLPLKRTASVLPDYSPSLATLMIGGGSVPEFKTDRALGRDAFFWNKRDWQGLLDATHYAIQDGVSDTNVYTSRATAFTHLGRWGEAQQAIDEARKQDRTGFGEDMIAAEQTALDTARRAAGDNRK